MSGTWFVPPAPGALSGSVAVPGDKSISHRVLMFNGLAGRAPRHGVTGLLESEDVRATEAIVQKTLLSSLHGEIACDCGNSGTTMRLMMGILAGRPGTYVLDGDDSLRRRPMERVAGPLRLMGAEIETTNGRPPVRITGRRLQGIEVTIDVASAQVKSAILLAALSAEGRTTIHSPAPSRDHTERLLEHAGIEVEIDDEGRTVSIRGGGILRPAEMDVPGDISSSAFPLVAALLVPGSEVVIENVGVNPSRTGMTDVFRRAGARVELRHERTSAGEPRADFRVRASRFGALDIAGDLVPRLIDEIPAMALAAALADCAETRIRDARELKVKETDRIAAVVEEFAKIGLRASPTEDGLVVPGRQTVEGGTVDSRGDHRIAMTAAVAGLVSRRGVTVENTACVETSFPGFVRLFGAMGARIEERAS